MENPEGKNEVGEYGPDERMEAAAEEREENNEEGPATATDEENERREMANRYAAEHGGPQFRNDAQLEKVGIPIPLFPSIAFAVGIAKQNCATLRQWT